MTFHFWLFIFVICLCHLKFDIWHLTFDIWHLTSILDIWHLTFDIDITWHDTLQWYWHNPNSFSLADSAVILAIRNGRSLLHFNLSVRLEKAVGILGRGLPRFLQWHPKWAGGHSKRYPLKTNSSLALQCDLSGDGWDGKSNLSSCLQ